MLSSLPDTKIQRFKDLLHSTYIEVIMHKVYKNTKTVINKRYELTWNIIDVIITYIRGGFRGVWGVSRKPPRVSKKIFFFCFKNTQKE